VGINTGLVLLGGETEARGYADGCGGQPGSPPGECCTAGRAADLARYLPPHPRRVRCRALEPITAKGFDEPVQVYRVLRARPRAFRLYTRGVEGMETRMVGRDPELKYLQDALLTAIEEGEGQMVTITGEAGVGKSRLLYEFQAGSSCCPHRRCASSRGAPIRRHSPCPMPCCATCSPSASRSRMTTARIPPGRRSRGFAEVFGRDPDGEMRAPHPGTVAGIDFSASPHLKGVLSDPEQLRNRGLMYLGEYFQELCETDSGGMSSWRISTGQMTARWMRSTGWKSAFNASAC
jgi:hypothetical protein